MNKTSDCHDKDRVWLLFDICRDIEGYFADLYHFYSNYFNDNVDIALMWKKTAHDEENHQNQFAMVRRMMSDIQCTANVDIDTAVEVRDKVAKLVKSVTEQPPDLATALKQSIELEEKLSVFHAGTVVCFADPSLKQLFSAMMDSDQEHVETLRRHYASILQGTN